MRLLTYWSGLLKPRAAAALSTTALLLASLGNVDDASAQMIRRALPQNTGSGCQTCQTCPPGQPSVVQPGTVNPDGTMRSTDPANSNTDPNAQQNTDPNAQQNTNDLLNPNQVFNNSPSAPTTLASNSNPGSIGDFFGSVDVPTRLVGSAAGNIGSTSGAAKAPGPYSPLGGRQKLVEHDNPLPRDRFFINYSYFKDVPLVNDGVHVNRTTFGLEKTFLDGMASIQVRVPTLSTLDSDVKNLGGTENQFSNDTDYQLGNVNLMAKLLLHQTNECALSVGTGLTLPTADDINLYGSAGTVGLSYKNEAIHVLPFVGFVMTPTDRCFSQVLVQADFDTNGNTVYVTGNSGDAFDVGKFRDGTFLYASWTTGYWLIKETFRGQIDHGIAPMFELHYNRSISRPDTASDTVDGATYGIGEPVPGDTNPQSLGSFEALNATFGIHAQCSTNCTLTVGYCVPVGGLSREDQFNGEARVLFNYFFGRR